MATKIQAEKVQKELTKKYRENSNFVSAEIMRVDTVSVGSWSVYINFKHEAPANIQYSIDDVPVIWAVS